MQKTFNFFNTDQYRGDPPSYLADSTQPKETEIMSNSSVAPSSKQQQDIRFIYLREDKNSAPRGVIAYTLDKETNTILYGYSLRNKKDSWNRELGKTIALGRMKTQRSKNRMSLPQPTSVVSHEFIRQSLLTELVSRTKEFNNSQYCWVYDMPSRELLARLVGMVLEEVENQISMRNVANIIASLQPSGVVDLSHPNFANSTKTSGHF